MKKCCLCEKKQETGGASFFRVPNDERRQKWSKICSLDFSPTAIICIDHFDPSSIVKVQKKLRLLQNAVPILQENKQPYNLMNQIAQQTMLLPTTNVATHRKDFDPARIRPCIVNPAILPSESKLSQQQTMLSQQQHPTVPRMYSSTYTTMEKGSINLPISANPPNNYLPFCMKQNHFHVKKFVEKQTQTDPVILDYTVDRQNFLRKLQKLETKIKDLELELAKGNRAMNSIKDIFTEGQIKKLSSPNTNIRWDWPDISSALCLHASGPRAYNHLYKKKFPLPSVSTLQRWCRKVNLSEGILTTAMDLMNQNVELEEEDKICVLAFDEMKVMETYEYDQVSDTVRAPANYVQVVMARGLRKSWKLPVFYSYDCKMTKDILNKIITELHKVKFSVVAVVSDMGPTNRKLWSELKVDKDKPWFSNPCNPQDKVFVFADAPHLIKLIRNHFLDSGLIYKDKLLTSRTILELLKFTSAGDASITFKLNTEHISVSGVGRQKVKLATQLFSNTTANAILRCYSLGMEMYNAVETAEFIQLVNDWFDVHNSSLTTFYYPGKEPFGVKVEQQQQILERMTNFMRNFILPNKSSLEFFQKGVIMSNNALMMLHSYVAEKYKMAYICTGRLNQDVLENFFGAMRSKGGLNDHPSPIDFRYRMRKYILARNTEHLRGTGNVGFDSTEWLNSSNTNMKYIQPEEQNKEDVLLCDDEPYIDKLEDLDGSNFLDIGALKEDALEYIAGYIIRKLNLKDFECQENSYTWVDQISKGFLKKPSTTFLQNIQCLEAIFYQFNGLGVSHCRGLHDRLLQESKPIKLSDKIKAFFFRCRIFFRIRYLNKKRKETKAEQRFEKKMSKIKN